MTQELTLQCSRVAEDEVYTCPEGAGLLLQVTQDGAWAQVVLSGTDALRLAAHIIMHVPREQTNEH